MPKTFRSAALETIDQANAIFDEYAAQGFTLTLRQLFYQFVSRGLIANTLREYQKLGLVMGDARLAGLVDWRHLEDRTRFMRENWHFENPAAALREIARQYGLDRWVDQPERVAVWIEKDALIGVIERVCTDLDVAYFSSRGYTSWSQMYDAAQRFLDYEEQGQKCVVIHLGDHDPSGLDMSRDLQARLETFGASTTVERLALNMEQVEHYNPPHNYAKLSDTRAGDYMDEYGAHSWELDALEPTVIATLIEEAVAAHRDADLWDAQVEHEESERETLLEMARNYQREES